MPKKLPEGIRRLPNGRYQARYPVTENGVTKQVSAGTFAKVQDAKDARALAMAQRKTGDWVDPRLGNVTVEAWIEQWRELRRIPDTKRLRWALNTYILPTFGAMRLADVEPIDVQRWVNTLDADLKPASVTVVYGLLRRAMTAAVELDRLMRTPCRAIVLPQNKRTRKATLTPEQIHALELAMPSRLAAMVHLGAWTGMRWGEVAALRWTNVDLTAGLVHVREAIKSETGQVGTTKNNGERTVKLSPRTVEVLTAHRRDFGDSDLLFPATRGAGLLNYTNFRQHVWYAACDKAGLSPRPGFHTLRHSYATHMTAFGLDPKALAENLGHSDAGFTMSRYGSARADLHSATAAVLEQAMGEVS